MEKYKEITESFQKDTAANLALFKQWQPELETDDLLNWFNKFFLGQTKIASLYQRRPSPISMYPSITYKDETTTSMLAYDETLKIIIATHKFIADSAIEPKKPSYFSTANLSRHGIVTYHKYGPIILGAEEEGHAIFDQVIAPSLDPKQIHKTYLYDGSDPSENFATQECLKVIQMFNIPILKITQP